MAQVGMHGLVGLIIGQRLLRGSASSPAGNRALLFGYVMGSLVPDLDYLAVVGLYPVNHTLALHLHRGFSHGLLAAAALLVGFYIAAWLMDDAYLRYMGCGLGLGVVTHFTLDILLWFGSVDVFWPASVFGIIPPVDIWFWFHSSPLLGRLLGAAEFGAFGLYYDYLARLALSLRTDLDRINSLTRMATICWLAWALLTALSVDLPDDRYVMYFYIPMGLIFLPSCLYLTWRMEETIERLGLAEGEL